MLLHAITNSLPISWLSFFGQLAAAWNVVGVFVLMIVLIPTVATERASADFVSTHFNTEWNVVGVFVLMILIPLVAMERASADFVFIHFNTDNGEGISSRVYFFCSWAVDESVHLNWL